MTGNFDKYNKDVISLKLGQSYRDPIDAHARQLGTNRTDVIRRYIRILCGVRFKPLGGGRFLMIDKRTGEEVDLLPLKYIREQDKETE